MRLWKAPSICDISADLSVSSRVIGSLINKIVVAEVEEIIFYQYSKSLNICLLFQVLNMDIIFWSHVPKLGDKLLTIEEPYDSDAVAQVVIQLVQQCTITYVYSSFPRTAQIFKPDTTFSHLNTSLQTCTNPQASTSLSPRLINLAKIWTSNQTNYHKSYHDLKASIIIPTMLPSSSTMLPVKNCDPALRESPFSHYSNSQPSTETNHSPFVFVIAQTLLGLGFEKLDDSSLSELQELPTFAGLKKVVNDRLQILVSSNHSGGSSTHQRVSSMKDTECSQSPY